ncbi:FecR domain-containing protein [Aeoliella mucimassa]|uniref:FecR protein n=1 Tax=Aeoliella mucimassa TaxID=2527972 RepID=A0A518AVF1_9BACT|nr:FecR domain-containing protein [Aeoliella mucimassa]QDU58700.1 FecR protein [Aeoliella mucimassa]
MKSDDAAGNFEDLVDRTADESLSAEEFRALEQDILEDPEKRKAYLKMAWLCGELSWSLRDDASFDPLANVQAEHSFEDKLELRRSRPAAWNSAISAFAGAAAVVILLYLGGFLKLTPPQVADATSNQTAADNVKPSKSRSNAKRREKTTPPAATLTGLVDCHWGDSVAPPTYGEPLDPGRRLDLRSGLAKLTFESGAQLILQGPSNFLVESSMDGSMDTGKLSAVVPVQAHGFKVSTPTAKVVDLGTEFGLEVDDRGDTEVHVFDGEVLTWPVDAKGEPTEEALSLLKDEAALIRHGQTLEQSSAKAHHFVRDISARLDEASLPPLPIVEKLQVWWAADVLVKKDPVDRVIAWRDILVGDNQSDEDAWQPDEESRPLWVEDAIGGQPGLRFDGSRNFMITTPFMTTPEQTVFIVFQRKDAETRVETKRQLIYYNGPPFDIPRTRRTFSILQIDDGREQGRYRAFCYAGLDQPRMHAKVGGVQMKTAIAENEPIVLAYVYDPAANRAEMWVNNKSQGTSNAPACEPFVSRKIVGRHPLEFTHFCGDIGEMLIYNSALAPEDVAQVNAYLGDKYSVPLIPSEPANVD